MKRLHSIALLCLVITSVTACRSNLGGIPPASSPGFASGVTANSAQSALKLSARLMPFNRRVGSSNTITADMPVPRPDTNPCVVTLFYHYTFKDFSNKTFPYKTPAGCPGPWAKVVFNFDERVTKGTQYDRTGILWIDGAVVYFGTTSEPSSNLAPHWHVERDVTDLSALFTQDSKGQVELWNCYCPPTYNGYQIGKAYLQFYPPDKKYPAPTVPDEVIGLPYSPPLGNVATLPKTPMEFQGTLPTNIVRAYADLYLESQSKEEQWFMCVPDEVFTHSQKALGFCRNTAFRQGEVSVDGMPAGIAPISPWIYTGGMDPYLWFPIPGVQTLEFVPYRVDLTPFAGTLSSGSSQTVNVSVFRAFDNFSGAGDLLLYLDPKQSSVTGAVTKDTLPANPDLTVATHIAYGSGGGLFGGPTAQGTINTRSRSDYTISGYAQTSAGKVTTTVTGSGLFVNDQSFDYTPSRYVQLATQDTHLDTTSTTQNGTKTTTDSSAYEFPLTVSYPILPLSTGYKLPIKVYQGYRFDTTDANGPSPSTQTSNTVKSADTMIFNSSFAWIGVRNGASIQLYTYKSKRASICYGKQIQSKNNVVTTITEPGCTATPPRRRPPKS
jgi:Peptide N-acetyl-beta-D-glucosaminyl asparaginase amidase A